MGQVTELSEDELEVQAAERETRNIAIGKKLREKLAMLQVVLENREMVISQWAAQYVDKQTVKQFTQTAPPLKIHESSYGVKRGGSDTKQVETIVLGLQKASPSLKEEMFDTPRFTINEFHDFVRNLNLNASIRRGPTKNLVDKPKFKSLISKHLGKKIKHAGDYTNLVFKLLDVHSLGLIRTRDFSFLMAMFVEAPENLRLKSVFESADVNSDGILTIDELHALIAMVFALNPTTDDTEHERQTKLNQMVELVHLELDRDGDGSITLDEFLTVTRDNAELRQVFLGLPERFHKEARVRRESRATLGRSVVVENSRPGSETIDEESEMEVDAANTHSMSPFRQGGREVSNPLFDGDAPDDNDNDGNGDDDNNNTTTATINNNTTSSSSNDHDDNNTSNNNADNNNNNNDDDDEDNTIVNNDNNNKDEDANNNDDDNNNNNHIGAEGSDSDSDDDDTNFGFGGDEDDDNEFA